MGRAGCSRFSEKKLPESHAQERVSGLIGVDPRQDTLESLQSCLCVDLDGTLVRLYPIICQLSLCNSEIAFFGQETIAVAFGLVATQVIAA